MFRMRILMIVLFVLGLIYNKVSARENSTKMHYAVIKIEAGAIPNITALLKSFNTGNPKVEHLSVTTECDFQTRTNHSQCSCKPDYIWSDEVCDSDPECCGQTNCTFKKEKTSPMCQPKTRVTVNGSFIMPKTYPYFDSLADPNSERYKTLSAELLPKLKTVYSTLSRFDNLHITEFRRGSVIVGFQMTCNNIVTTADLARKTLELESSLKASFMLETTGLVDIDVPSEKVRYNSNQTLRCTTTEDMKPNGFWELLKIDGKKFYVTTGTESTVTTTPRSSQVVINSVSEVWAGIYTCLFQTLSSNVSIVHKATKALDVALLPRIEISSKAQFPHCEEDSTDKVPVKVQCNIRNSTEIYTVTWNTQNPKIKQRQYISNDEIIYEVETSVSCRDQHVKEKHPVKCTFMNSLSQKQNATIKIHVIYYNSIYCKAEGIWPKAKAGFTAVVKCKNSIGNIQRRCLADGKWEKEESFCVNHDLNDILQDTLNLGKGLGVFREESGKIFYRLKLSTNNSEAINSYSNVNASVTILTAMHNITQGHNILNESVLEDLVESSSNILSDSLGNAWNSTAGNEDTSIAERYLNSVDGLINNIEMKNASLSKPNLELISCSTQDSHCRMKVFNATVSMHSPSYGVVKTVGFKHLSRYLPHKDKDTQPNSIVVSTTLSNSTKGITIDFELIIKRPRHHKIKCVYWDPDKREWSGQGCKWAGATDQTRCECNHLSSFTTLMSKQAEHVDFIEELTYIGLAVSIISLILCLVIEFLIWHSVVKSNVSYFRHIAHVNISVCLLIADCSFFASSFPDKIPKNWCQICVLLKHFGFLAMFFWMLCLSVMLLHQMIFIFHQLSKKTYLVFSFCCGYLCPLLIVTCTFISYKSGQEKYYYDPDTCWLIYDSLLKGSLHSFLIPVGTIVLINVFCMVVVVMRLLKPSTSEVNTNDDKNVIKGILKAIILLTPIFGVTWLFGFLVFMLDLTMGPIAFFVNYAFTLLNAFQGLFILLTTCLGEKLVRDTVLKHLNWKRYQSSDSENSSKLTVSMKRK